LKKCKLSEQRYQHQYNTIKNIMKSIGIECSIYIYESDQYTGKAGHFGIALTTATIQDYNTHPYVLRFFAAHELIHYKHKEYGYWRALKATLCVLLLIVGLKYPFRRLNARILLSELRASIEGSVASDLSPEELFLSQDVAQRRNNDSIRPKSYQVGYPDREMIKEYATRYVRMDKEIAARILDDYCAALGIQRPQAFKEKVISAFFKGN